MSHGTNWNNQDSPCLERPSFSELPLIDQAAVREWCEDLTPEDISDILAGVPGEAQQSIEQIMHAIGRSDLAQVKRVAHRLKGMAANLGAPRLAQIARHLETTTESLEIVVTQISSLEQSLGDTLEALKALR